MSALEDFGKTLNTVVAAHRRPQPKLTNAEKKAIMEAARPFFDAYEAQVEQARANGGAHNGPAWYGYGNDGSEYTGAQKQEVLSQWMEEEGVPDEKSLLRATLGEKKTGPGTRARGPVTFYTFPSPNGIVALWIAKSDNLALLKSMVAADTSDGTEGGSE